MPRGPPLPWLSQTPNRSRQRCWRGGGDYTRLAQAALFLELHGDILRNRGKGTEAVFAELAKCGYTFFEHNGRVIAPERAALEPLSHLLCLPELHL
jgi:hypothetical protein